MAAIEGMCTVMVRTSVVAIAVTHGHGHGHGRGYGKQTRSGVAISRQRAGTRRLRGGRGGLSPRRSASTRGCARRPSGSGGGGGTASTSTRGIVRIGGMRRNLLLRFDFVCMYGGSALIQLNQGISRRREADTMADLRGRDAPIGFAAACACACACAGTR